MGSSFLITLREGLEAGLIVAIILAYLKSTHQRPHFRAILREGLETAVFLFAATRTSTPLESTMGASAGILAATALTWGIYSGGYRINLRGFFNVTGVMLIILAAGLLVNGLKELHEAAVIGNLGPHVWDTYNVVADNSQLGKFLGAILGYDSSPYLGVVIAYVAYLVLALSFFTFGRAPSPRAPAAATHQPVAEAVPEPEGS